MSAVRIGDSPNRVGGDTRVTGHQEYVADIHLAGELHAKLVTIPVARGWIARTAPAKSSAAAAPASVSQRRCTGIHASTETSAPPTTNAAMGPTISRARWSPGAASAPATLTPAR